MVPKDAFEDPVLPSDIERFCEGLEMLILINDPHVEEEELSLESEGNDEFDDEEERSLDGKIIFVINFKVGLNRLNANSILF